jgi:hypothetical protein
MIDQHRHQIAHVPFNSILEDNRIQQLTLLLGGNRRIFPNPPQIHTLGQQPGNAAQAADRAIRIQMRAENYVSESARVSAGNGSHA